MLHTITAISVPAIITSISALIVEIINMSFIGHLGDTTIVAGIGIGNMYINVFFMSIIVGMNQSLSTFIPHAYGAGYMRKCGHYVN